VFDQVDLVLTPTTAAGAPRSEEMMAGRMERFFTTIFTPYWDAVGNPALVVPMGFSAEGLPLSLQLAGRPFEESLVCRAGDAYQRTTDWHLRVPPLVSEVAAA
jgi:aspartyl-tRNA(Asn)/glutamyl-tRNA(Gln) amidotransferase subunit A